MSLNLPRNWRRNSRRMLAPSLIALLALLLVFAAACEREGDEEDTRNDNGGFTESVGDQSEDDESAEDLSAIRRQLAALEAKLSKMGK